MERPCPIRRSGAVRPLLAASLSCAAVSPAFAAQYVLGPADSLALDQPRVAFGLTDEAADPPTLIGPTFPTQALLDTGANGVLLAALSYGNGEDYGQPAFPFDYDGDGTIEPNEQLAQYAELGVAGTTLLDVHEPHGLRIEDSLGVQRLIGTDIRAFGDSTLNIGSYSAIIGMPAMEGYAVEVDLRPMASLAFQEVIFHDAPGEAAFESAASMNIDLRIIEPEFTDPTFIDAGRPDLLPTFAGLPVIDHVDLKHTDGANSGGATLTADDYTFLLDTGAQTNIISEQMATDLGLDFVNTLAQNGDVVDFLEVGGIGGMVLMPLVLVDEFSMPTQNGPDLVFTDLLVGVLDIDGAPFDAVFGMNMLTSGYLNAAFGGGSGTEITNPQVDEDDVEFFIEQNTITSVEDLIAFDVIRITAEEVEELGELGLLSDPDDPLTVYTELRDLEGLFESPAIGTYFDKVVFDFTPDDGTAVMRLDLTNIERLGDVDYDGDVDDADYGLLFAGFTGPGGGNPPVQAGLHALGDLDGGGDTDDADFGLAFAAFTGPGGPPAPTADLDGDGDVDDADFGLAFANFTGPGGSGQTAADGDLDGDGDVDDADFGLAFAAFTGPGASANVPEPSSLMLLAVTGWIAVRRRRD